MRILASLKHPPFALLWSGQTLSGVGDAIYELALAWYVLQKTGSATAMATVFIVGFAPMLLFVLIGGVWSDRLPRVHLMLGSDLLRGAAVSVVTVLAFSNHLEIWQIYVASVIFGSVDAFFRPAYNAAFPDTVPSHLLPSANALTSLSKDITGIAAPALGAIIVAFGGTSLAFGLDALSFALSSLCLLPLLRLKLPEATPGERSSLMGDLREGIHTVRSSPWLWVNIAAASIFTITNGAPYNVALPFLVRDRLGGDVRALGLLYSVSALGSIAASLWFGQAKRIKRRGIIAFAG